MRRIHWTCREDGMIEHIWDLVLRKMNGPGLEEAILDFAMAFDLSIDNT